MNIFIYHNGIENLILFDFSVKEADVDMFTRLVNHPSYPLNQRVLRLKELPPTTIAHDICTYFKGSLPFPPFSLVSPSIGNDVFCVCFPFKIDRSITEIHMIHDKKYQVIGEAFVMFETMEDVEWALWSVLKENKKIHDKHIKVFRNSQKQFQMYCDTNTITKISMDLKSGQIIPMENAGENHRHRFF